MNNKELKRRIIEISYKKKLSHIGSCLTAVDIIDEIFQTKKPGEKFILSSGHAGLALYVVLEKYQEPYRKSAEEMFDHHGVHPDRCISCGIDCSAGSLGHGLGIAVGIALADRSKNVYCLISDGEITEGSIWEALRIAAEEKLSNLIVIVNHNGWGAYGESSSYYFSALHALYYTMKYETGRIKTQKRYLLEEINKKRYYHPLFIVASTAIYPTGTYPTWLQGQLAHYKVMNEEEYKKALEVIG